MASSNTGKISARRGKQASWQVLRAHPALQRLDDARIAAIVRTGATLEQVEQAAVWAQGASDVVGKAGTPLTGVVARVYDILTADQALEEE